MNDKLEKLVESAIEELEYTDTFLVDLKVNNTKVEVFIDSDENVTFEKCRKISRKIEAVLDEEQWLGEKYTLDVSSSGVGKPLKMTRQYIKNIGRTIHVVLKEGEKVKGVLSAADEEKISVEVEKTVKQGKKKTKVKEIQEISYADIDEAKIKISFK